MTRTVKEWIGRTPDDKVPARVKLRVFLKHEGICHLSGWKIGPADAWDLDHVIALCNGGEHRERNFAPALRDKHREKTRQDVALKSATYESRKRHLGLKKSKNPLPGGKDSKLKKTFYNGTVLR